MLEPQRDLVSLPSPSTYSLCLFSVIIFYFPIYHSSISFCKLKQIYVYLQISLLFSYEKELQESSFAFPFCIQQYILELSHTTRQRFTFFFTVAQNVCIALHITTLHFIQPGPCCQIVGKFSDICYCKQRHNESLFVGSFVLDKLISGIASQKWNYGVKRR